MIKRYKAGIQENCSSACQWPKIVSENKVDFQGNKGIMKSKMPSTAYHEFRKFYKSGSNSQNKTNRYEAI